MDVPEQKLPPSYEWFADQIAGHHPSVIKNGKREIGLIKQHGSDKILKPKQEGFRGECEVNIYKLLERALRHSTSGEANHSSGDDIKSVHQLVCSQNLNYVTASLFRVTGWEDVRQEDIKGLAELTPAFHGITPLVIDKEEHEFLILEDVTAGYTRPAILDVKMGRITYDPVASEAKREKETIKYPPQRVLGFRLLGYRMHRNSGEIVVKDKEWGKAYNENNILDGKR
ncbi:hypothetical protein ANCDUO_11633 [Ancylostoma duodenale]|uniref:Kinase n=1 Tax=Ancylostoma duodenale TaxID=51022 RepID=A0A0C2GM79_9BILA|nr:hypothetical protein ANCDUO_11633 [Ancylostoma duodenale]